MEVRKCLSAAASSSGLWMHARRLTAAAPCRQQCLCRLAHKGGSTAQPAGVPQRRAQQRVSRAVAAKMGLKALESFDASFTLDAAAEGTLKQLLCSETFCRQVCKLIFLRVLQWAKPIWYDAHPI